MVVVTLRSKSDGICHGGVRLVTSIAGLAGLAFSRIFAFPKPLRAHFTSTPLQSDRTTDPAKQHRELVESPLAVEVVAATFLAGGSQYVPNSTSPVFDRSLMLEMESLLIEAVLEQATRDPRIAFAIRSNSGIGHHRAAVRALTVGACTPQSASQRPTMPCLDPPYLNSGRYAEPQCTIRNAVKHDETNSFKLKKCLANLRHARCCPTGLRTI